MNTRPRPPKRVDFTTFKLGDMVGFTDKHLREQWRVSPELLRKIIDL